MNQVDWISDATRAFKAGGEHDLGKQVSARASGNATCTRQKRTGREFCWQIEELRMHHVQRVDLKVESWRFSERREEEKH
jgi:hypothetical protein